MLRFKHIYLNLMGLHFCCQLGHGIRLLTHLLLGISHGGGVLGGRGGQLCATVLFAVPEKLSFSLQPRVPRRCVHLGDPGFVLASQLRYGFRVPLFCEPLLFVCRGTRRHTGSARVFGGLSDIGEPCL